MPNFQNNAPYYDNSQYEISQDYVQLLFNPGRALQARELTELQSLLQYQLSQVGDFLFKNGSVVQGGHITFDNSVTSIQIQANDNISLSDFEGKLIINPTGPVTTQAVVIAIDDSVSSNTIEGALIIKYLSAATFGDGATIQIATGTQEQAILIPANSHSQASIASINDGVFYADGYLVQIDQQTIVLSSLTALPSVRIGLQINEGIVTSASDSSLLDPAQGSFNYQAPGADRYQYQLVLSSRLLSSTDDSKFFELLRIVNGVIVSSTDFPQLGSIDDQLAQRTFDADGNFTVNPFIATTVDDPSNTTSFLLNIGPGKAYVEGYEFETISPVQLSVPKARTTNATNNYIMSLDYGNFLTVTNVYTGNVIGFNTGNFGNLDLHMVVSENVNTTSQAAYQNTKIGTARIRDIEFEGPGEWLAYLLDINMPPIVVNASAVSANTSMVYLPTSFSRQAAAFSNVKVTVLAGNSSGDVRTITSYTPNIGILDRATTQLLDTTSQLSIQFGIKDINGLVGTPSAFTGNAFFTQNSTAGLFPCMDVAVNGGKDTAGNTVLFDTNLSKLEFLLPQPFIAQNSFSNITFYNRKTLANVNFVSGNATIGTGSGLDPNEVYTFGFSGAYLPTNIAQGNFLVVVRNAQSSNLANGMIINWDIGLNPGGNGVFQTDSTHCTIKTVTAGNFVGDVLLTVQDQNASVNFRRSKTLTGNTANTTLQPTDSYLNGLPVIGSINANSVYIDTANGYTWYTNWGDIIAHGPGKTMGLGVPDIVQIIKIYTSGSPNFAPNVTNAIDVTTSYSFVSGQKDNYYDHGQIILNAGSNPPSGQTVVIFQYYAHDSTSGYFSADSYTAGNYANNQIPVYNSEKFGAVNLRDVIDFRPTRTLASSANIQSLAINGLRLPQPDDAMTLSYSYYLGRQDKLLLTRDRQFQMLSGVPGLAPVLPPDQQGTMTLYTLAVPSYTFFASNVTSNYIQNRRYTMRDIGGLDNRIQQLEYYVSLSQLDQSALSTTVLYQNGTTAKEQFGVVTDSFVDLSVVDTGNPDMLCYIANGVMQPFQQIVPVEFQFTSATGPFSENDRTFTISYTEQAVIVQNTASDFTQIQPYAFGQFNGDVTLRPQTDIWYSDSILPQIIGPVDPPPPATPPPAAPTVTTGATGVGNQANLTPKVVNQTPAPVVPPPAATPIQAAPATQYLYCTPNDFWWSGYTALYRNNNSVRCLLLNKGASGFGVVRPGQWLPQPATYLGSTRVIGIANNASRAIVTTRSGFGI